MADPARCPSCDCADSPLSILSNIAGILTFALSVLAYIAAFAAITRGAAKDIQDTRDVLRATQRQIVQIEHFLEVLQNRSDPDLYAMESLIGDSLQDFKIAKMEMDSFLNRFKTGKEVGESRGTKFRWWYYGKEKEGVMEKLRRYQQHFAAVQLTFLESKIKRQSDDIEDLIYSVDGLQKLSKVERA